MNRNAAFAVACLAVSLAVAAACFASGTGWPILALLSFGSVRTKKKGSDRAESALLSSLRNIANQNNLRKDTIKRANLQNWKFAFAFTA